MKIRPSKLNRICLRSLLVGFVLLASVGCRKDSSGDTIYRDGQPPVSMVEDGDPEMEAAMQKAKDSIQEFITALEKPGEKQFSIKVGTIMEDSPIGLDKWLPAMWMIATCKNGVSSYEIAHDLSITQKSAWFLLHRIREAMRDGTFAS